jgi:lipopolysaccharide transport system ATP-binding protein
MDIRRPVGIEMTYEVLEAGKILVPNFHFFNEQGACIFISHDWSEPWRTRTRPTGIYASTAWIPGNFLAEGHVFVTVVVSTYQPLTVHFTERDAVVFNVVDSLDGNSARGDYAGLLPGIVRPILEWETEIVNDES